VFTLMNQIGACRNGLTLLHHERRRLATAA
jgi:hypothetical protein